MFGFSFGKIVVLVAVVAAVWYGFRWLEQRRRKVPRTADRPEAAPKVAAEETVQCPQCGAFVVAKGASNCGRADCPY
jgi:hypothetical protein